MVKKSTQISESFQTQSKVSRWPQTLDWSRPIVMHDNSCKQAQCIYFHVTRKFGMASYVWQRRYILTAKTKAIRTERCSFFFVIHQASMCKKKFRVCGREVKIGCWCVSQKFSSDCKQFFWRPPLCLRLGYLASIMVSGTVAGDGSISDPQFIEFGLKIGTKEYLDILDNSLLPWMEQKFGIDNVVFIRDSAQCHRSKATQTFLSENIPFFVWRTISIIAQILTFSITFYGSYNKQGSMLHHIRVSTVWRPASYTRHTK